MNATDIGIVLGAVGLLATSVTGCVLQVMAARKVEAVKTALETSTQIADGKLDAIAATGDKTHTLVNSNMGVQLKLNATLSRRLANLTSDSSDIQAAKLAEKMLHEHEGKQATVDANERKNI